jgi:hypothetical protein
VYRALPAPTVDLIRDGAPARDLRAMGDAAVRRALLSTAASAMQCGWTDIDWETLIMEARSRLGAQVRTARDGRRDRPERQVRRMLADAWDRATEYVSETPAWDRDTMRAEAEARAAVARGLAADPDTDLTTAMRAVLAYAAGQAEARGLHRLALPWRAVADATGLGQRATQTALRRLTAAGYLRCEDRGRGGTDPAHRRAALYRLLPDGAQTYGTPTLTAATQQEDMTMPTTPTTSTDHEHVTLTGTPAAVADLIERLRAAGAVGADGQVDPERLATVLPLRPVATS